MFSVSLNPSLNEEQFLCKSNMQIFDENLTLNQMLYNLHSLFLCFCFLDAEHI